jgi:cell division protein FtsB
MLMVAAVLALSVNPARDLWRQWHEMRKLEADLIALRRENEKLKVELERLKTDAYIEQEARARLGLVKPGERAYVIVPPKQESPKPQTQSPKSEKKVSRKTIWQKIWDSLSSLFK